MTEEWKGGAFHRNAPHVKQATVKGKHPGFPLAFQEYSPDFPHKKVFREPNLMLRACQSNPQKSYCLRERTTKYRILFFTLVDNVFPSYHNVISVLFFWGGGIRWRSTRSDSQEGLPRLRFTSPPWTTLTTTALVRKAPRRKRTRALRK